MKIQSAFSLLLFLFCPLVALAEDFELAALIGQTGASSIFGKVELDGYTLAIEEWNKKFGGIDGKPVKLVVDDTRTDQRTILTAFQKFAAEGHAVMLGPTWLDAMQGIIPVARSKDIALVTASAEQRAFTAENKWPITLYYHSPSEAKAMVASLAAKQLDRVVILVENEPFAELMHKLLVEEAGTSIQVLQTVSVSPGETNFKAILPRVAQLEPKAIIILVWDESSLLALLKDLKRRATATQLVTIHDGEGWLTKPDFKREIDRLIYPKFVVDNADFQKRFLERFGYEVNLTGSNAYDAAWSVLKALSAGNKTGTSIRNYLLTNELDTVTFGKIRLTSDGAVGTSRVEMTEYSAKAITGR